MRNDIESAYRAWNDAFNRGDAPKLAACYAENARLLPPGHAMVEGLAAIEAYWAGLLQAGMTDHTLGLVSVEEDQRGAVAIARWSAKGKGRDGGERRFEGGVVHVFARRQGEPPVIWLHIWN
jgi:ketosteroid isomerase-like protein